MNINETARAKVRQTLARSSSFQQLPKSEQFALYKEMVEREKEKLAPPLSRELRIDSKRASDLIDEERYNNQQNLDQADDRLASLVEKVDFPKFVADLLKGVFDANLDVTLKQMEAYQKLLKSATASLSKFVKEINDEEAFYKLAEEKDDEFGLVIPDIDDDNNGAVVLTDKDGNTVDTEDTKIKALIMDAKLDMAKERRAMLRESVLMGITRLVVEKGTVKAGVVFEIKSKAQTTRTDSSRVNTQRAERRNSTRIGFNPFRGFRIGRRTGTNTQTEISVATNTGVTDDELNAKLTGEVEIIFKSDYFKLDNFAQMYGNISDEEQEASQSS